MPCTLFLIPNGLELRNIGNFRCWICSYKRVLKHNLNLESIGLDDIWKTN